MTRTPFEIDENESDSLREEMKRDKVKKPQCPNPGCDEGTIVVSQGEDGENFEFADCPTCNGSGEIPDNE